MQAQTKIEFKGTIVNDTLKTFSLGRFEDTIPARRIQVDDNGNFSVVIPVAEDGSGLYLFTYGSVTRHIYLSASSNPELTFKVGYRSYAISFLGNGAAANGLIQKIMYEADAKQRDFMLSNASEKKLEKQADEQVQEWNEQIKDPRYNNTAQKALQQVVAIARGILQEEIDRQTLIKTFKGKPAPGFSYSDVNGNNVSLADFTGKYVVIDVWATWCEPCRDEIPALKEIEERLREENIVFVGISIDKLNQELKWKNFVVAQKLGGVQLIAENAWNSSFMKSYGVKIVPTYIIIGPDGSVLDPYAKKPSQGLERQLKRFLRSGE